MTNEQAIEILKVAKAEVEWECPLDYQIALDMAIANLKTQSDSNKCMSIVLKTGEIINLNCDGYNIKDYNMLELYKKVPTIMTREGEYMCDGCNLRETIAIFNIEDLCGFWMSEERCRLNE